MEVVSLILQSLTRSVRNKTLPKDWPKAASNVFLSSLIRVVMAQFQQMSFVCLSKDAS